MNTATELPPLSETLAPADEAAVVATMRDAVAAGRPVYPVGGATRLDYGVLPQRPGIGLSLSRLDRIVEYSAADGTITVEAGLTAGRLAKCLAEKGQRLPVDVAQADRATIGGLVATALAGPRRYAHGTIRDYVVGLRAVDGLGMAFSAGGRVARGSAGYNLCRLLTGSLGTLGVVTQVTLAVRPLPESSALVVCEVPGPTAAERLLEGLARTKTAPVAIDLLAGSALNENGSAPEASRPADAMRLIVGYEGSRAEVDAMVRRLEAEWQGHGASPVAILRDSGTGPLWDSLTNRPAHVQIGVLPSATAPVVGRLLHAHLGLAIHAHAGNGLIRLGCPPTTLDRLGELLDERLRPIVAEAGGAMVVLASPPNARLGRDEVWGPPRDGAALMQAIKDRFDPNGLLNPGRFVFAE